MIKRRVVLVLVAAPLTAWIAVSVVALSCLYAAKEWWQFLLDTKPKWVSWFEGCRDLWRG